MLRCLVLENGSANVGNEQLYFGQITLQQSGNLFLSLKVGGGGSGSGRVLGRMLKEDLGIPYRSHKPLPKFP